jgi:hypothetical protein
VRVLSACVHAWPRFFLSQCKARSDPLLLLSFGLTLGVSVWHMRAVHVQRDRGAVAGSVAGRFGHRPIAAGLLHLHEGPRLSASQHPRDTVRQGCKGSLTVRMIMAFFKRKKGTGNIHIYLTSMPIG